MVPARPEQHNTAASAMPRRAALVPPPPPTLSSHSALVRTVQALQALHGHPPNAFSSAKSNKYCMGARPMPSVPPKVINTAWAHAQCLQFRQK